MSLTSEEVAALVAESSSVLEVARVDNVHQCDEHTVVLTLRSRTAGKLFLLFSTRPRFCRFHLVPQRAVSLPSPPPFCETARKLLKGTVLKSLRQVSGDRVVEVVFSRKSPSAMPDSVCLVLEMIGLRGQLVLVRSDRTLLATLHPFRRGSHDIPLGERYCFPEPRPQSAALKSLSGSPWRYLESAQDASQVESAPAPLHFAFARHYASLEADAIFRARKEALTVAIRRASARRRGAVQKIRGDLEKAEGSDAYRQSGELLKGAFGQLRRGMSVIELENYFEAAHVGSNKVRIELDPALGPQQNIERYFKRYRKSRRALPFLRERLAKVEVELGALDEVAVELDSVESVAAVVELEERARGLYGKPRRTKPKGSSVTVSRGPRRFVSQDGYEILVGRNAKQNDELTLRMGRGNDLFFHVSGKPGAHVLVRTAEGPAGQAVPLATLLDAAQLSLYYSLPEQSRGALQRGASATVDYAPLKHVKKPKGAKPGLVHVASRKTLRVSLDAERIARLRGSGASA
jgi:predicted ribosome quality control (RQC) complex YloA/Tae2 family protein